MGAVIAINAPSKRLEWRHVTRTPEGLSTSSRADCRNARGMIRILIGKGWKASSIVLESAAEARSEMGGHQLVVLVTIGDAGAGTALGRTLVEERLAACVQVIPGGVAIYRWQGELHSDPQA